MNFNHEFLKIPGTFQTGLAVRKAVALLINLCPSACYLRDLLGIEWSLAIQFAIEFGNELKLSKKMSYYILHSRPFKWNVNSTINTAIQEYVLI